MDLGFVRQLLNDALKGAHAITKIMIAMWAGVVAVVALTSKVAGWQSKESASIALALLGGILIITGLELILSARDRPRHVAALGGSTSFGRSIRLMWTHGVQSSGIYSAIERGIKLEPEEGGSPIGLEPIPCVMYGINDFGVTSALDLIRTWHQKLKNRNNDIQLVPCLLIFRRSPSIAICRDSRVLSLNDLNGARVMFPSYEDSVSLEFQALLNRIDQTVTSHQIECNIRYAQSIDDIEHPLRVLESGDADYRVGYVFNEGLRAKMTHNHSCKYLHELFTRPHLYADVFFTSLTLFNKKEKECREVARAVRDGYLACAKQPQALSEIGRKWFTEDAGALDKMQKFSANFDPWGFLTESISYCVDAGDATANAQCLIGKEEAWRQIESLISTQTTGRYVDFLDSNRLFDRLTVENS